MQIVPAAALAALRLYTAHCALMRQLDRNRLSLELLPQTADNFLLVLEYPEALPAFRQFFLAIRHLFFTFGGQLRDPVPDASSLRSTLFLLS